MAKVYAGIGKQIARDKDIDLDAVLQEVADEIESFAVGLAAQHVQTSDYVQSLQTSKDRFSNSGRDRVVFSDDPAAVAIEYGHLTGKRGSDNRRPVEGQHILGRAMDAASGPQ